VMVGQSLLGLDVGAVDRWQRELPARVRADAP